MRRLLGQVAENDDGKNQKRVQAHIIGLTEGIKDKALPWAFPLDDQTMVPGIGDKVWIFVDQDSKTEDYDYNRLWYERFTEETYKEAYDVKKSDSHKARAENKLDNEPDDVDSV